MAEAKEEYIANMYVEYARHSLKVGEIIKELGTEWISLYALKLIKVWSVMEEEPYTYTLE